MIRMNDREYKTWVKNIVIKPLRANWGDAWHKMMVPEIREQLVMAQCMSVVMTWCGTKQDDGRAITNEEILRLVRVAQEIHREDHPRDYPEIEES